MDGIVGRFPRPESARWGYEKDKVVVDAVMEAYPDISLEIWRRMAEKHISQVKPKAYEEAAIYLRKMRMVYKNTKRLPEWREYLEGLRAEHKRKRRLLEVLDALEIGGSLSDAGRFPLTPKINPQHTIVQATKMRPIENINQKIFDVFYKHGHDVHRLSLGLIFIWFGLLKPFGEKTTTSLLAHTIYFFSPEIILPLLGWWEVAIGLTLMFKPLVKYSIILQFVRIPGTILALIIHPEICFIHIPYVPSPEGQYLIKDIIILFAGIAIAGTIYKDKANSNP